MADCFWISPSQESATKDARVKNIFHQQSYPNEGIFALNLFVRGRPVTVTIDDYVPIYNGGVIFGRQSGAGLNIWNALLEKSFAKLVGNYEYINYGW